MEFCESEGARKLAREKGRKHKESMNLSRPNVSDCPCTHGDLVLHLLMGLVEVLKDEHAVGPFKIVEDNNDAVVNPIFIHGEGVRMVVERFFFNNCNLQNTVLQYSLTLLTIRVTYAANKIFPEKKFSKLFHSNRKEIIFTCSNNPEWYQNVINVIKMWYEPSHDSAQK